MLCAHIFILSLFFASAYAQEKHTKLAPVLVQGDFLQLNSPLAPSKVSEEKIKKYQYTDVNRALRNTNGVYIREEDGQGLRPNIGMRGTNPDRSKKIVLMEDGVLVSPAPYAAPAAYFTPSMNHVSNLEVYKGFAGLPYGPNSIGGALNYVTPNISLEPETEIRGSLGSFNTVNTRAATSGPTSWGGYLLQVSRVQSDGFKHIDGGGDTGYEQNHFLGKFAWRTSAKSRWNLTVGAGSELSNETYLGLAKVDFDQDDRRRYVASSRDQMRWQEYRVKLQNVSRLGSVSVMETTAYHHQLHRNWYRFDRFADASISVREMLLDPTKNNYPTYFGILTGSRNSSTFAGDQGQIVYARNERTYWSQGIQTKLSTMLEQGAVKHKPELTLRLHSDGIQRNHKADYYAVNEGRLALTSRTDRPTNLEQDSALAFTAAAVNNIEWASWVFTPIVRFENVQFRFEDDLKQTRSTKSDFVWVPGLGILKKLNSEQSVRASVNRATTVAGLNRLGGEVREEAINYELEWRYLDQDRRQQAQLTGFLNDYKQITGTCTASNGCLSQQLDTQYQGGKAHVYGWEASAQKTFRALNVDIPVQANVTYLVAEFAADFDSTAPEWGVGQVRKGDPLPYVPVWQYSVSTGMARGRWSQDLMFIYQDRVFDQSAAEGRQTLSGWGIIDWTGSWRMSERFRWTAKIDNILDRRYAVAARPFGFRPGKPQAAQVGFVYTF